MKVCVLIPAYNESFGIGHLVGLVIAAGFDVVVVDDGSKDTTAADAQAAGARVIRNPGNQGKGVSLIRGFTLAVSLGYDAVITMDGDGQHDPAELPHFVEAATATNAGVIIGNRMGDKACMPLVRKCTNIFMSWLISLAAGQRVPDSQSGFRLIRTDVLRKITLSSARFETESELIIKAARAGFSIGAVPIKALYRGEKSQIRPFRDTLRFIGFYLRSLCGR